MLQVGEGRGAQYSVNAESEKQEGRAMITRLVAKGFKNLVGVDVRFGPFTCIAGPNGIGKSNVFDAIFFLSSLADKPLLEAAMSVRGAGESARGIRNLFTAGGPDEIHFQVEMLIPREGKDDLGQKAEASSTFVVYEVSLRYRPSNGDDLGPELALTREELNYITKTGARQHLPFRHAPRWRESVVYGKRTTPYMTTEERQGIGYVKLHQDRGTGGRPREFVASSLPRTVLSTVNAQESPTAVLVRQEMRSWRLLQLEPSSLRAADEFAAPPRLSSKGAHLPSALHRLARLGLGGESSAEERQSRVYSTLANKLSQLIDGVGSICVDRDDKRELLTLMMRDLEGRELPASSLSDGTLRFIALTLLEMDPDEGGLLCLEEPENGIHPERIPAMLRLLQDIAVDSTQEPGIDNPLRQVIVNTHSPTVVAQVPDESLLFAEIHPAVSNRAGGGLTFRCLPETWRTGPGVTLMAIPRGKVRAFLQPVTEPEPEEVRSARDRKTGPRRVIDHVRQPRLPLFG